MKENDTKVAKTIQQHNKESGNRPKLQNGYAIKSHVKLFINLNRLLVLLLYSSIHGNT